MTEQQVRKLKRVELFQIIRNQEEEILQQQEKIQKLEQQLTERTIRLEQTGSIAEAALQINGVMEAAQKAADQYLESIRQLEQEARRRAEGQSTEPQEVQPK
jgi:cell division septum initiation protein DivIVA